MNKLICAIYTVHEGVTVLCGQPLERGVCPVHGENAPGRETGTPDRPYADLVVDATAQLPKVVTGDDVTRLMSQINDAKQQADRSYRQAISTMGAHQAPAVEVVAFVIEWRLQQTAGLPVGLGPNCAEMAQLIVDALRETGHLQD